MRNGSHKTCREKENTILYSISFFRKSHRLWDNVEKYGGDWGATNDVTIWRIRVASWVRKSTCIYARTHAHAPGYPHTRTQSTHTHTSIRNTYCFLHGNNDSRTRLNITLYVYCLYCYSWNATGNIGIGIFVVMYGKNGWSLGVVYRCGTIDYIIRVTSSLRKFL